MVLILKEVSTGKELCLGYNNTYFVGRKKRTNIQIIIDDKTVSKNHAVLYIQNGIATIKDLNSKRGTFLNKLKVDKPTELRNGDVIVFGIQDSKFCFLDLKWETQINIINFNAEKFKLMQTLDLLGIRYYEYFNDDITHYTTDKVTLQCLKKKYILHCLIDRKPIVSPKFWYDIRSKSRLAEEVPQITNYTPKIDKYLEAQGVNNIDSNLARRFLFDDKIFICFDINIKEEYTQVINKCGGEIILYENSNNFIEQLLCKKHVNYIIVKNDINIDCFRYIQYLENVLKENQKSWCITSPNNILISILKVSFNNFTDVKKLFSGPNITDNRSIIQTNDDILTTRDNETQEKEVKFTCDNVNVKKKQPKKLVINPLQQINHRKNNILIPKKENCSNTNQYTELNEPSNTIVCANLISETHIVVSNKRGNKRKVINPVSTMLSSCSTDEKAVPVTDDIKYWQKKYKKIEITEV